MQQVKLSKVPTMQQELLLLAEAAESANGKIFIHGGGVDRHSVLADARPPLQEPAFRFWVEDLAMTPAAARPE